MHGIRFAWNGLAKRCIHWLPSSCEGSPTAHIQCRNPTFSLEMSRADAMQITDQRERWRSPFKVTLVLPWHLRILSPEAINILFNAYSKVLSSSWYSCIFLFEWHGTFRYIYCISPMDVRTSWAIPGTFKSTRMTRMSWTWCRRPRLNVGSWTHLLVGWMQYVSVCMYLYIYNVCILIWIVCLCIYLSVCVSIYLSIYLFVYLIYLIYLFIVIIHSICNICNICIHICIYVHNIHIVDTTMYMSMQRYVLMYNVMQCDVMFWCDVIRRLFAAFACSCHNFAGPCLPLYSSISNTYYP